MNRLIFHPVVFFCCLLFVNNLAFAQTVTLDSSFNELGFRLQAISQNGALGSSLAIQSDGKIVLGGWTLPPFSSFAAMRLNEDGTLDTSFSNDGIVITQFASFNRVEKLQIQPDGKIILGGTRHSGQNDFALVRYNTNGTLDTSFDGDGMVASPLETNSDDLGLDMALQNDGKIVMVGSTRPNDGTTTTDVGIIRRNSNGSLDTGFNGSGKLIIRFNDVNASANSVLIQPNGKIVIGGFVFTGTNNSLLLMRFNPNGTLDTSFGKSGLVIKFVSGSNHTVASINQQSDGKILAGSKSEIYRFSSDGIADETFGTNGRISTPQTASEILTKNNDSFLVGGTIGTSVGVSSHNADGSLDTTFNNTGSVSGRPSGNECGGHSLAIQKDAKIVIGGSCQNTLNTGFAVFRFVAEKDLSNKPIFDFDGDGKTDISIFRPGPTPAQWWLLRSSDGGNNAYSFGLGTDKPVPADFTGDGKSDLAFFRESSSEWFILRSEDSSFYSFPFGASGDIPAPGDFDGDGIADAAVYRPSGGTWFINRSSDGGTTIESFGIAEDKPTVADFDGDGKDDIAIYRPSVSQWWQLRSADGVIAYQFGTVGDKTVQGDYTGDGKADVALFRPSSNEWFILRSENGTFYSFPYGASGDIPTPGDYDGDGTFDAAVFRPSTTTWFLNGSTSGTQIVGFGLSDDVPLPNVYSVE